MNTPPLLQSPTAQQLPGQLPLQAPQQGAGGATGGNPLDQLADIHLPEAIDWWPLAPGWWALIALTLLAVLIAGWLLYRRWLRNAWRREAADQLQTAKSVEAVNSLLKRAALASHPHAAALSGSAWLAFLREQGAIWPESLDENWLAAHYRNSDVQNMDVYREHAIKWVKNHA